MNRVIVEAVLAGKSQSEVARLYGISQPRVSQLVAAWRSGGWAALEPRSRRPHTSPTAIPTDLAQTICDLRRQLTAEGCDAGPNTIAALLHRNNITPPSVSTIWKTGIAVDRVDASECGFRARGRMFTCRRGIQLSSSRT